MYQLTDSLRTVKGVGEATLAACADQGLHTIKDLLLALPLRYEDRSQKQTISEALALQDPKQFVTIQATASKVSEFFKFGRRITSAQITDHTGSVRAYWFNNRFIKTKLETEPENFFSGKISAKGILTQPTVEAVKTDTIHTGRLVPVYSSTLAIKQGSLRRILKKVVDELPTNAAGTTLLTDINQALKQLHFPDSAEALILARERLALEELLALIKKSRILKQRWHDRQSATAIKPHLPLITTDLPFQLTADQEKALAEIVTDLTETVPMNRLLVGDVGSGKTIVAALACRQMLLAGHHAVIAAPTQILAEQHHTTIKKLFPDLDVLLITSTTKVKLETITKPTLCIGTHSVLNRLQTIRPGLIVYDEQHRFGVRHRSPFTDPTQVSDTTQLTPHILTMTATPIPRSLMLTIFAHLSLSTIEHLPAGRQPITTWLVPEKKRPKALEWLKKQLTEHPDRPGQALVVCPFIDPSSDQALENVAAASEMYQQLVSQYQHDPDMSLALLHSRLKPAEKQQIMTDLFANKIRLLVSTPIVEVGVDIPAADVMIIEAAERFGLASLHQLRGRVGRAGQAGFCLLFTNSKQPETLARLKAFTTEHRGSKLAELDLAKRGAGDIFGTMQHGFGELIFSSWANLELIQKAKTIADQINLDTWLPILDWQTPQTEVLHN